MARNNHPPSFDGQQAKAESNRLTEEAKNQLAEIDGAVDDFVVRTQSKTDKIIRDYTAVASNSYKGISVLDDNGNLRNTYDIYIMCLNNYIGESPFDG